MSGIKHIEFWVSNLKDSLIFYEELFTIIGWEKVEDNTWKNGDTKIYFIEKPVLVAGTIGPRHICFLAGGREVVDQVGKFLKGSNAEIVRGPKEYAYKERTGYTIDFKDPDGYVLEVATKSE